MTDDSRIERAWSSAMQALQRKGNDLTKLPIPSQTLVLIYSAQGIIDNGGFEYFFENDFDQNPPYSLFVDAYRRIGATDAAELIASAVKLFPFEDPHLSNEERRSFLSSLDEDSELVELGDRLCEDESVWTLLATYVENNAGEFFEGDDSIAKKNV